MSTRKFREYANYFAIGSVGVAMVAGEQHLHIHQNGPAWPDSAFGAQVVTAVTTTGVTSSFTGTSSFQR
jgi:hypothetical protein